jgi:hypothetical protein
MLPQEPQKPSLLDAPIPGESLTANPGEMSWETPPQINTPQEAVDHIKTRLEDEEVLTELVSLIDSGVSAEGMAKTLAFAGFVEGLWTPDVAELIQPAIYLHILEIAEDTGVDVVYKNQVTDNSQQYRDNAELRKALKPESLLDDEPEELQASYVEEEPQATEGFI